MIEKINQLLRHCVNWSIENKQCRLRYEPNHICNVKDLFKDCKGYANPQLCTWYKYSALTDEQIRKMRDKLRRLRP